MMVNQLTLNLSDTILFQGKDRGHNPKKVTIRNANTMCSVLDLYFDREKYLTDKEYPHYFVDRNHIWQPRLETYEVPSHPDNIVIEVCQDLSASKDDFISTRYTQCYKRCSE